MPDPLQAVLQAPAQGMDANLKLAIEDELARQGRRSHVEDFKRLQREDEDGRAREVCELLQRVLASPLGPEDLQAVEHISWGRDTPLLAALDPANAFGAWFNIRSLEGVERCPQLTVVYIRWHEFTDLSPLARLPSLRCLAVEEPRFNDLRPLLEAPSLKTLVLRDGPAWPQDVVDQLKARGVVVDTMSRSAIEGSRASNPGSLEVEDTVYQACFPDRPLNRDQFRKGCVNPGVVVALKPVPILAVCTDLATGKATRYPTVKLVAQPLDRMTGGPPKLGQRLATAAFYYAGDQSDRWRTFDPVCINCVTASQADIERVFRSIPEEDWSELFACMAGLEPPYNEPGKQWTWKEPARK